MRHSVAISVPVCYLCCLINMPLSACLGIYIYRYLYLIIIYIYKFWATCLFYLLDSSHRRSRPRWMGLYFFVNHKLRHKTGSLHVLETHRRQRQHFLSSWRIKLKAGLFLQLDRQCCLCLLCVSNTSKSWLWTDSVSLTDQVLIVEQGDCRCSINDIDDDNNNTCY